MDAPPLSQRIDRWLWHARIVKTRDLAQELVRKGRVRRNRQVLDAPASPVRTGDVLTVTLASRILVVEVIGFAERRGSAEDARRLVRVISPVPPETSTEAPSEEGPDHAP
jgi:ribosome-associated heat shock protein Hsp15